MLNRTTRAPAARGPMSDATLDLDFVRMRGFVNGAGVSLENIITETRASTAMTAGPGGILRATPATTPRFARRWDGRGRGLLVENAGANALHYSADFTNSAWTKSTGCAVTGAYGPAPDGTQSACLVTDSQASGLSPGSVSQGWAIANDSLPDCGSIYVKAGSITSIRLTLAYSGGSTPLTTYASFDLTTGYCYTTSGSPVPLIERAAGGFYRLSIATQNNSTGNTLATMTVSRDGASAAPGTFQVWGGQGEGGIVAPTSYIPTTTTFATRSADAPSMVIPSSSWFSLSGGWIYIEGEFFASQSNQSALTFALFGFPATEQILFVRNNAVSQLQFIVTHSSSNTVAFSAFNAPTVGPANNRFAAAVRYNTNDYAMAARTQGTDYGLGQLAILTAGSGALPSALNLLQFGNINGSTQMSGVIERVIIGPTLPTNQELIDMIA